MKGIDKMQSNPKVSVIVPVYKVEKYIKKCVNSIINQTYKNLEIILVDDGSPDKCPQICDEYALKDNRIKVIHKENGGVSRARNTAIKAATGEYICFVDSDDWISENYVEVFLENINKYHSDVVFAGYLSVTKSDVKEISDKFKNIELKKDYDTTYNLLFNSIFYPPWNKIFRKDIIDDHSLIFNPDIPYSEDTIFVLQYIKYCKTVTVSNEKTYYYNQINASSAVKKYFPDFHIYNYECTKTLLEVCDAWGLDYLNQPDKTEIIFGRFDGIISHYLYRAPNRREKALKLKESYDLYKDWLSVPTTYKSWLLIEPLQYFKDGNYEGFVDKWIENNWFNYYKYRVNRRVKKILER